MSEQHVSGNRSVWGGAWRAVCAFCILIGCAGQNADKAPDAVRAASLAKKPKLKKPKCDEAKTDSFTVIQDAGGTKLYVMKVRHNAPRTGMYLAMWEKKPPTMAMTQATQPGARPAEAAAGAGLDAENHELPPTSKPADVPATMIISSGWVYVTGDSPRVEANNFIAQSEGSRIIVYVDAPNESGLPHIDRLIVLDTGGESVHVFKKVVSGGSFIEDVPAGSYLDVNANGEVIDFDTITSSSADPNVQTNLNDVLQARNDNNVP